MSTTYTTTDTFTRTNAIYLASKVAADLKQMQLYYGNPSDVEIYQYIEELVILLLGGYLDSITYGYQKGADWITALNYSANFSSIYSTDDRSGGVIPGKDITGAVWGSYLRKNSKYNSLSSDEKERVEQSLPFTRTGSAEPSFRLGSFVENSKNYYSGGASLDRRVFIP